MRYVFGDYTLDTEHYELHHGEKLVRLEPRVFNLLAYLVQHPGHTLTKDELWAQVWPQLPILSDQSLKKCVEQARKALGDAGKTPRYIETMRGRGYRFIAAVDVRQGAEREAPRLPATPLQAAQPEQGHTDGDAAPALLVPVPLSTAPLVPTPVPLPEATTAETGGAVTQNPPEDEWRQLTVLVCHLGEVSGSATPRDRDAREARLADVRDYQALCAEVVQRFEGHIAQYQVERLIVHFGYPRAHEDDARRAVHTGLGIVEGMAELNRRRKQDRQHGSDVRLTVQVGIHTGLELIGAVAHGAQRPALAVGETVTIATGLQRHAGADTVLISPATWRLVEGYFVCEALGAQVLDDCAQSLAVYRVLQAGMAQSRLDIVGMKGLTPFVGRDQEVGLLGERWQQAKDGLGQVVVLSGEAGIGKSRLVQILKEAMAVEAHVRVEYHCSPYYQHTALYPIVTSLQRLLQFRPEDPPEERLRKLERLLERYNVPLEEGVPLMAALLALPLPERYPPLQLTPQRQKQKTLELVLTWWLKEAERQPVCVIMEDLHWADASTLELLTLLIEQVPTARILLLLLCRPDFHPPWGSRSYLAQIALGRLSRRQVETMVVRMTGGKALPTEVLQALVAKTDGVPLFVEELTKMVLESGLVKEREGQYVLVDPLPPLAIPDTLHDSLMARLDRLGAAKQVAQLGATIGREFSYELIQAVAPVEEAILQKALTQLVEAELLYQRGLPPQVRYWFKHALIQAAAYQSILKRTRQQHHQRITHVLVERFPEMVETHPELLAHHYTEAGLWQEALLYWRKAGQRAFERSAHREAVICFEEALAALQHLPESRDRTEQDIDLRFNLRHSLVQIGELRRILDHLRIADTLAQAIGDQHRLGLVCDYMGSHFRNIGKYYEAVEAGERSLAIAQDIGDFALQVAANFHLGAAYYALGDYRQGIDLFTWNLASLKGNLSHERFGLSAAPSILSRGWLVLCLAELGEFTEGIRIGDEALRIAEMADRGLDLVYAYRGVVLLYLRKGELDKTIALAECGLELCQVRDLLGISPWFISSLSYAYALSGRIADALPLLDQAASTEIMIGWRALCFAWLSEASLLAGRMDDAIRLVERALELSHDHKERGHEAWALRILGEIHSYQNLQKIEQAEAAYRQAMVAADTLGMRPLLAHCHLGLGTLYHRMGRLELAQFELSVAVKMYRAMEMAFWLTRAQATRVQTE
jgi:DNA-binding winged helix-turn-helix (wHTH) protein/tetratricopeptide (TPR) repeat protein/class 3 adenylate cyclase